MEGRSIICTILLSRQSGNSYSSLTPRVLILGDELNASPASLRYRSGVLQLKKDASQGEIKKGKSDLITWLTTSKKKAQVELGLKVHIFHWQVPPKPISVSETQGPLTLRETQDPTAPETLSSLEHLTSKVPLKAIFKSPF